MKLAPNTRLAIRWFCIGLLVGITTLSILQYAIDSYNRNGFEKGYRAGQIDYKKGKKCFKLIETNTGEIIYEKVDSCDYEVKKTAVKHDVTH